MEQGKEGKKVTCKMFRKSLTVLLLVALAALLSSFNAHATEHDKAKSIALAAKATDGLLPIHMSVQQCGEDGRVVWMEAHDVNQDEVIDIVLIGYNSPTTMKKQFPWIAIYLEPLGVTVYVKTFDNVESVLTYGEFRQYVDVCNNGPYGDNTIGGSP
jgi:hypothetical protein